MKKRILSMALALILALGLAVPSLAAGPTFTDVPETHWAYADVETAAANGLMKGTGGGAFSPDMKVSVAQFLTLVGRVVFPDVKAEGDDWYGPYIQEAQSKGLLNGTQVNVNTPEAEISRYDMAVILRGAAKKLGAKEALAQSSQVTDYGLVPTMYADAVLAVYGMDLIQGDQNSNFNGTNTMMRSEVATVVMRLIKVKPNSSIAPVEAPEKPDHSTNPTSPEIYTPQTTNTKTFTLDGFVRGLGGTNVVMDGIQLGLFYKDGRLLAQAVTDENGKWEMEITIDSVDYDYSRSDYYLDLLVPFEYEGWQYHGGSKSPRSLRELTIWEDGCAADFI